MKNLSIVVVVDEDMNEMKIKALEEGFTDVEFSFCIYKILKELYRLRDKPTVIASETFHDEVER